MTRNSLSGAKASGIQGQRNRWSLQNAKAHFSELVRLARSQGPQLVTVHGRDEAVVVSTEDFRQLSSEATGQALVDALQASPNREFDLEPRRSRPGVRAVNL